MADYKIDIMGEEWGIKVQDEIIKCDDGIGASGLTEPDKRLITLSKDVASEEHFSRTLIHELMHAHLAMSGITCLLDDKMEEAICELVENFVKIMSINKGVLKKAPKRKKK